MTFEQNILIYNGPPSWWIKIADFGMSEYGIEEPGDQTQTATYGYMAPEILGYFALIDIDKTVFDHPSAADIWAAGCIVYRLTTGVVPFLPGPSLRSFCWEGGSFPLQLPGLSELGYQFVRDLLVARPSGRLTVSAALDHVWIWGGK